MSRERNGKFKKGFCGNPKGRPVDEHKAPTQEELRNQFLRLLAEKRVVPLDGKKQRMTCREVILRQLITQAMKGDKQLIVKVREMEEDIIAAKTKDKIGLLKDLVETERDLREHPESVTQEKLDWLRDCRRAIDEADNLD